MAQQHAPRGPIKAKGETPPASPDPLRHKCKAHSKRTGKPCTNPPMRGGTVCRMHGGAAPQVKAAAEKRLAELRPAAIRYLDWLLAQKEFPSAGLGAAKDVLDRNDGKPTDRVELSGTITLAQLLGVEE